jgi:ERF superfamily protein
MWRATAVADAPGPQIYGLMAQVLANLPAVGKDQVNSQQGFAFRGIDDVMNALNPVLSKHGVFFVPAVEERIAETRMTRNNTTLWTVHLKIRYTFFAPDGSSVEATMWGEGTDVADKATSKAASMAMKYALFQVFAISNEEMNQEDGDRGGEESSLAVAPVAAEAPKVLTPGHALADAAAKAGFKAGRGATPEQKEQMDLGRRDVLAAVTGKRSTKDLTPAEVKAALEAFNGIAEGTVEFGYDEDGVPTIRPLPPT